MKRTLQLTLSAVLVLATAGAQAQFHRFETGTISVGGTGQFSTVLTSSPNSFSQTNVILPGSFETSVINNQQQYTTLSAGFVSSLQLHPVSWAGLELNYGFTRYSERYSYNTSNNIGAASTVNVSAPTYWHEATGAYIVHPKHIPFQPYVGIGGGAIDFARGDNQWRGAGLLEMGFDMPVKWTHVGFRIGARSLYYRSPNFNNTIISTRSWRVTSEPEISTFYRF